jgi:hypothetical protein
MCRARAAAQEARVILLLVGHALAVPAVDAQTWRLPVGSGVLVDEAPRSDVRVALGWTHDPIHATWKGEAYPVVDDLLHADVSATWASHGWMLGADTSVRAVWEGQVGVGDTRAFAGAYGPSWVARVGVVLPTATMDAPLASGGTSAQAMGSKSALWGRLRASATLGATFRLDQQLGHDAILGGSIGYGPLDVSILQRVPLQDDMWSGHAFVSYHFILGGRRVVFGSGTGTTTSVGSPVSSQIMVASLIRETAPATVSVALTSAATIEEPAAVPTTPGDPPVVEAPVVEAPVVEAPVVEAPMVRLDPEDEQKIQRLATMLSANRAILRVRVEIHLDGTGDPMARGEVLVTAARGLLTVNGITPDRVEIVNRGATAPLVTPEVTDQDRAKNRRVDVIVVQVGSR